MARTHYPVDMYCHNRDCEDFGEKFPIRVTYDSWDAPSEYVDDPECPICGSHLYNERPNEEEDEDDD